MFALPRELIDQGLCVRPATPSDDSFFRTLFATARQDAALLALWPPSQREPFLDQQFGFQSVHYRAAYAGADFLVVEQHTVPIGRLILDRGKTEWQIVDIALLPDFRGQGVGTALLASVLRAAADAGAVRVGLLVEIGNVGAHQLYSRLGFVEGENSGTHVAMIRTLIS